MAVFKVGDKVRIRKDSYFNKERDKFGIMTIVKVDCIPNSQGELWHNVDVGGGRNFREVEDLEHVYIRNNSLARALYPNHEVINEKWILPRR